MEIKVLLSLAAGIAAFFIAYNSGNKLKAILIPAGVAGILTMLPVLVDPKALGAFGVIGLVVFVLLASLAYGVGAAVGCFAGILMRSPSEATPRPTIRQFAAIGILIAGVVIAGMQIVNERKLKRFGAIVEVSGDTFLRQQKEVLSKTGPVIQTSIFAKGRNKNGLPLIIYFVKGEQGEADVQVEASGTEDAPVLSIRAVEPRPNYSAGLTHPSSGTR